MDMPLTISISNDILNQIKELQEENKKLREDFNALMENYMENEDYYCQLQEVKKELKEIKLIGRSIFQEIKNSILDVEFYFE